jgi:general secretion pathway protein G
MKRQKRARQSGMTLVEIMVVLAIFTMVMGAVGVGAFRMWGKANCKKAWADAQEIAQAVTVYETENNGDCPKSIDELVQSKFLTKAPIDPWGQPYMFKCPGDKTSDGADIWSKGKNKADGDEDDVRGWVRVEEVKCAK